MPNFEPVIDKLRIDLARNPQERAEALAYIRGKRDARICMALAFAVPFVILALAYLVNMVA